MKKIILRVTTLLLLICMAQSLQTALAAPKLEDLKKEAYDIMEKSLGYQKQDVIYIESSKFGVDDNTEVWRLEFKPKEYPQDEDGRIAVDFSLDGVFLSVKDSEKIPLRLLYQYDYSQPSSHPMGKLLELQQKWQPHLEELEKAYQAEWGVDGFDEHRERLTVPLFLPSADDYDLEKARENANNAILSLPGWTEEKFSMYPMFMEVLYDSNELDRKVYQFIYTRVSPVYDERTLERYIEEYEKPLFSMFGGSNGTTPSILSVQLDSKTGDLIGEPFIDYPPIDRFPLFMLR